MTRSDSKNIAGNRTEPLHITTSIEQTPRRNGTRQYPRALPQPVLNILRPCVAVISRMFWRIRWKDTQNIPSSGGVIIAANHQTYVDPFWVGAAVKRPVRFLAWDAAFNWPVAGRCLKLFGAWPLQLEGADPTPIRLTLQWLREGGAVVIFPEGGRGNADGSLKKFKAGAVRMALEAGVPILPVTICGGEKIWPNTNRVPRLFRTVEIVYHPLFQVEQCSDEDARACARRESERLAAIVRSAL